ncbi:hypothetical protein IGI80_002470 [Enterococcus sp. DIV1420a]
MGKRGKRIKKQNRKRKNATIANGTYNKRGKSDGVYKVQGRTDYLDQGQIRSCKS